ncbi:MAG: glycosyltransferase [Flavobacteriaceae bacterium]|nr:glycosyltransferase [Flavobacteriaceae bacterium]
MKFSIITHAAHKKDAEQFYAYEPYVREMNLWCKHVTETNIVAPLSTDSITKIETAYVAQDITLTKIPSINILSIKELIKTCVRVPIILWNIYKSMIWADHIHIRCPGNIGFLACMVQTMFPNKPKTVKYAGNWDPNSKTQPRSYNIQKWILSNTFLTKNCKVLVYGKWSKQSKNIKPFFTASYSGAEIDGPINKDLNQDINLIFVGAFSKGKQPLKSVKVTELLRNKGYNVYLNMYGDGEQFKSVKRYVEKNNLNKFVFLHGNQPKLIVKTAFKKSHFLVFISKSEGWPKVVAEAMFWGCLPISTAVSCVPFMLGNGERGALVADNVIEISEVIESYFCNESNFLQTVKKAAIWSQQYTLEKFETEIKKLI